MRRLRGNRLWLFFAAVIFGVLLLTTICMGALALLLSQTGFFHDPTRPLAAPIALFVGFSILLGSLLSLFVGKTILAPVGDFTRVARAVANGDFSARATQSSLVAEVSDLAENLNTMALKLSHKETLNSTFIRDVSHEFNTPLSTIEGYATLLQDPLLPENEREEYASAIVRAARQLGSLSGNVLRLSSLEDTPTDLELRWFRLDEQIRRAFLSLERQWTDKNLALQIDLPRMDICADQDLLRLVWDNLLANAIKFTRPHGTIGATAEVSEEELTVTIFDDGYGMDVETQQRIFEKFFQADSARSGEGNGLGLALVQKIITLSGGTVSVSSTPGKGARFLVSLPRVRE